MPKRKPRHYAAVVSSDDDDEEQVEPQQISFKEEPFESDSDDDGDGAGGLSKKQALRKLLEPLAKDRIMELLKEAASEDPSIRSLILQRADCDPAQRKLFVHGFGWETTEPQLRAVFAPFGAIEELKLVADKVTGKLKGYAFVLYKTLSSAQKALKQPSMQIGNRTAYVQLAAAGPAASPAVDPAQKKLFVKNVAPMVSVDRLRQFFAKFGEIENGPMGLDSDKKFRGYAIFEYKSVDGLQKALEEPVKQFEGCQLECKKFIAKAKNGGSSSSNGVGSNLGEASAAPMPLPMQQNVGMGMGMVANPMWAAAALNQGGYGSAMAGFGGNYGLNTISPNVMASYGLNTISPNVMASYGSNAISPNVMASYGSQMALQGWPGQTRNQPASETNVPSYFTS